MKHVLKLFLFCVAAFLLSCKNEPESQRCHQYFLIKDHHVNERGSQLFYNSEGLLTSAFPEDWNGNRLEFVYDANKNLSKITFGNYTVGSFSHDADNNLIIFDYDGVFPDIKSDSIVVTYDDKGRISRRVDYNIRHQPYIWEYYEMKYLGNEQVKVDQYDSQSELRYTDTVTFDNKQRPFPKEYDYYLLLNNYFVVPGNIRSATYSAETHTYEYNEDGYPTSYTTNGVQLSSYVYSCTPVSE